MTEQKKHGAHSLSPEDRERMARLFEEITGRQGEMALIIARTLGIGGPKALSEVTLSLPEGHSQIQVQAGASLSLECTAYDDGTCGCYDYKNGLCYSCA